jgi:hypothetical protein
MQFIYTEFWIVYVYFNCLPSSVDGLGGECRSIPVDQGAGRRRDRAGFCAIDFGILCFVVLCLMN